MIEVTRLQNVCCFMKVCGCCFCAAGVKGNKKYIKVMCDWDSKRGVCRSGEFKRNVLMKEE